MVDMKAWRTHIWLGASPSPEYPEFLKPETCQMSEGNMKYMTHSTTDVAPDAFPAIPA